MLELRDITKIYEVADQKQTALNKINISFRENEFVSILGQSGSGKTTLLNIVGGLDRYTSGDLIINGISTTKYGEKEWNAYRNHSVGFVFQSYNLIPHQTVLSNVELALTLAGVSKKERRERSIDVLNKVGLGEHIHKRPNQMSGGQMQRVAIARALVNNPDILLADEPTGALDSETSIQIMNLLKEIAKDKLVVMVTHNPELAEIYSTRIIKLLDGAVVDDTNPFVANKENTSAVGKKNNISMSFFTALSLSFNNLKTKKGRTLLTAFAGSIGIIGIALVLSLSSGMKTYIDKIQEDTLSSYPITIQSQAIDLMGDDGNHSTVTDISNNDDARIYQKGYASDALKRTTIQTFNNDLGTFKEYLQSAEGSDILDNTNAIQYEYDLKMNVYKAQTEEGIVQVNPNPIYADNQRDKSPASSIKSSIGIKDDIWTELLDNQEMLESQYDVLEGKWPEHFDEVVLVANENNEINDMALYSLGLKDIGDIDKMKTEIEEGNEIINDEPVSYSFQDLLNLEYRLVLSPDTFEQSEGLWIDKSNDDTFMKTVIDKGTPIKVVGIVKPSEDAVSKPINGTIGYLKSLTDYYIDQTNQSEIVQSQLDNKDVNVITGKAFVDVDDLSETDLIDLLSIEQRQYLLTLNDAERKVFIDAQTEQLNATYDKNLEVLGVVNMDEPKAINLFLQNFDSREKIIDSIDNYNETQRTTDHDKWVIEYTDMVGLMTSSVKSIIDMITYLLVGFVSISLIVSSIMIGIITYISVLERTKEIGILRSIGASKRDVGQVFNAETVIIGLIAGVLGIGITLLLNFPVNAIIFNLTGVKNIASLPVFAGIFLIVLNVFLTMLSGLIPARMASKKDPVEALRSE